MAYSHSLSFYWVKFLLFLLFGRAVRRWESRYCWSSEWTTHIIYVESGHCIRYPTCFSVPLTPIGDQGRIPIAVAWSWFQSGIFKEIHDERLSSIKELSFPRNLIGAFLMLYVALGQRGTWSVALGWLLLQFKSNAVWCHFAFFKVW